MGNTFSDIEKTLRENLSDLKANYGLKEIGIFGSFAREEHGENSDVDILVEISGPMGFVGFQRLENHLSSLLGRRVDLVTRGALKPRIGQRILGELRHVG